MITIRNIRTSFNNYMIDRKGRIVPIRKTNSYYLFDECLKRKYENDKLGELLPRLYRIVDRYRNIENYAQKDLLDVIPLLEQMKKDNNYQYIDEILDFLLNMDIYD